MTAEKRRLQHAAPWRKWGPYLADRAWGTVREDYSANGDAWSWFPHDHARSRAYRWGEDGIAGWCDRYQTLCWSLALWNGADPILKERWFGLVPSEGNHGEDVKEYYFYVDAVPTHAYQRMLYKYPQRAYPYGQLIDENRRRGGGDPEFELLDTGIFDDDRYFDVEVEIAKADEETTVFRVTAHNRGPDRAPIHLIPNLWFRNSWSWGAESADAPLIVDGENGVIADDTHATPLAGLLHRSTLGAYQLDLPPEARRLFTDNETNAPRIWGAQATSKSAFVKDAFHRFIVDGEEGAVNPAGRGTKSCGWMQFDVDPGASVSMRMVLRPIDRTRMSEDEIDALIDTRRGEADEYYASIHPKNASDDERNVQRQAFAGLIWTKQSYLFDVDVWLDGDDPAAPPPAERQRARNARWRHLNSMRILSMPDKWEYPWFAAWDLAFHAVTFALVDAEFAKEQLWLMLFEQFQHPNGQIPAYEWEFSDLNPPVHAWAVWRVFNMDRIRSGKRDREFLEKCFHKLMLNFTWWVNKVDREGNNVFEGGFLGLDNITVIDRSQRAFADAVLEQSDATGWMGMFCLVMMRISLELAKDDPVYEGLATKFFEHYVYVGAAMKMLRGDQTLWDDEDGFFYDILRMPDGASVPFRVRSLVGLIPLYAIERLEESWIKPFPVFHENLEWFLRHRRDIVEHCVTSVDTGDDGRTHVLAVVARGQLERLLARVVDPKEFLSPHGLRSLSKAHQANPFTLGGATVGYEPGDALAKLKGGNSNWRGPVWFPTSFLMIESLRKLEKGFGGDVRVAVGNDEEEPPRDEPPAGDSRASEGVGAVAGRRRGMTLSNTPIPTSRSITLTGLASELANRMIGIFTRDENGYRASNGPAGTRKSERFAKDPHWRDLILFYEFFHGDSGEGLGASHQTGWTALVANLIDEWRP